ncbi:MAG: hypothetical protein J5I59_03385 [Saprospiraceae bacterium]|nr:hypothetical protein [Saprospiraceae bacterium]
MKRYTVELIALFLIIFGTLTIFAGTSVLFDWFDMRARQGNYVTFVVIANVFCGFLYLIASYGLFHNRRSAPQILMIALFILILTFIMLVTHIVYGLPYEKKTIGVMLFRITLTLICAFWAKRLITPQLKEG